MGAHTLLRDETTTFLSALVAIAAFAPFVFFGGCEPRVAGKLELPDAGSDAQAVLAEAVPIEASAQASSVESANMAALSSNEAPPAAFDGLTAPCVRPVAKYVDAHRSCKVDTDCVVATTGCGMPGACGVGVQASAVSGLAKVTEAALSACTKRKVPLACPTCTMAPPARCGTGYCRP